MKPYLPLLTVIALSLLAAVALGGGAMTVMRHFMGMFFLLLSLFKLFDLPAFADGFQKYDLLAARARAYAYAYPFIELLLGLLYLSGRYPEFTYALTVAVMALSAAGVLRSLRNGLNVKCACLGTALNVPLSTVSVVENVGMGLMAAGMLAGLL